MISYQKPVKRRYGSALMVMTLAAAAIIWGARWQLATWSETAIVLPQEVTFEFRRGTGLVSLGQELQNLGLVDNGIYFYAAVRYLYDYRKFQAGMYRFSKDVSPQSIVKKLSKGDVYVPIVVQYTIPEGFTLKQIAARLEANGAGQVREINQLLYSRTFLKELNIPAASVEGFFYPATYAFTKTITAREAITEAVQKFWRVLPESYADDARAKGLSLIEAVTFASLIEVETRVDAERPLVAEVIWRRLRNGEPLAIDAALIYGIKDYRGDITWAHLKDKKNRYNTRIHKGLPPSPICSPTVKSLEAVLNPANEGYYYYVRDMDSPDQHYFSRTLAEHNRYVAKLVEKTKRITQQGPKK